MYYTITIPDWLQADVDLLHQLNAAHRHHNTELETALSTQLACRQDTLHFIEREDRWSVHWDT